MTEHELAQRDGDVALANRTDSRPPNENKPAMKLITEAKSLPLTPAD